MRSTSLFRHLYVSAVSFLAVSSISAAVVKNRITTPAAASSPTEIANSIQPRVARGVDLGPTAANTKLQGMSIRFSMTAEQQVALDQLLADLQNPSSPRYHQWLTPQQFAAQFGPSSDDIAKVKTWLTSQGFTVTGVANGGQFITFDGTVAQADAAFGTSIHNISYKGETHYANISDVQIPSAFSGVVANVTGLHNFRPRPHAHTTVANPRFTSSISGNHYIAPGDMYTIYNSSPLLTNSITGTGVTIAVTGQVDIYPADVAAFRTASGLGAINLTTVHEGGDPGIAASCSASTSSTCTSPNQDDLAESSIDVEWSSAMAPTATILFVNGPDIMFNAMTQAIDQNLAPIITTSYGACEQAWGVNDLNTLNALFKQANAQGQTILAASGDVGATDCDAGPSAQEGLAVDFPSSSPYVTSMGGTQYYNDTSYWNTNSTSTVANAGSALSYIPETIWNDGTTSFAGGGGGASAYFAKPAWQTGTGVPADGARDVPDLALNASDSYDQFLYCVNVALGNSCTSGFRLTNNNLTTAGGTSFDSQLFGGMLALLEQKIGSRIGNANPMIYALANNSAYYTPGVTTLTNSNVVFNDVTAGDNKMTCTAGTANCTSGTEGFSSGNGYDQTSGWGSVNLYNMVNAWKSVTPLSSGSLGSNNSTTALTASTTSVAAGSSVTLTATVSGTAGTPTGTVTFYANGTALGAPVALTASGSSATSTYTFATTCAALGQKAMTASYSGDANYNSSIGPSLASGVAGSTGGASITSSGSVVTTPLLVTVTSGTCPDFSVTTPSSTITVAAGGTIPAATLTIAPLNGLTGTVSLTATATSNTGYTPTVTVNPASVTLSGASVTTSVTLSGITAELKFQPVPGHASPGTMAPARTPWYAAGSGISIASLLCFLLPKKRRLGGLLALIMAVALVGGMTGCGGSSQAVITPSTNQYAGTYVVTVVGTYTSGGQTMTHSTTINYNIN